MTTSRTRSRRARPLFLAALALAWLSGCAHAQPVRPANGHQDPDYPEANCDVNNTVDCRPGGSASLSHVAAQHARAS